jgi:ankyrin repeat protein
MGASPNHFKCQLEAGLLPNTRVVRFQRQHATQLDLLSAWHFILTLLPTQVDEEFGGRRATTPILCIAARYGWVPVVEMLLEAGADAKAVCTTTGGTALHNAATQSEPNYLRTAQLLIDAGCPLEALMSMEMPRGSPSYKLQSPALHMAVLEGDPRMVTLLLDAGADINARNRRGETALIIAAYVGAEEVSRVLLARGADATLKDGEGRTAKQIEEDEGGFGRR